jgi:hypothetical protein
VAFDLASPAASDKSSPSMSLSLSLSGHENESSFGDVLFPHSVLEDDNDVIESPMTDDGGDSTEAYLPPRGFEWRSATAPVTAEANNVIDGAGEDEAVSRWRSYDEIGDYEFLGSASKYL